MENKEGTIRDIDLRIGLVKKAWSILVDAYQNLEARDGWAHFGNEKDLECFLFHKIIELMQADNVMLKMLHSQVEIPETNQIVDIVFGMAESEGAYRDKSILGIEIKNRNGNDLAEIRNDLDKLKELMKEDKIRAGIFVSMDKHSDNLSSKLQDLKSTYNFELLHNLEENIAYGNFAVLTPIKTQAYKADFDWDALFIVLRKSF